MLGFEHLLYAERSVPCSPVVLIILFASVTQGPVVKPASTGEHTTTESASTQENVPRHNYSTQQTIKYLTKTLRK